MTHGLTKHPIYKIWCKIKERCYCKTSKDFPAYGAKGVVVCKAWRESFKTFYKWSISNGWRPGLQIDKDIRGSGKMYSPAKCMFVTSLENNRHQSTTKLTQDIADEIRKCYSTKKYTQVQLANLYGVKQSTISVVLLNQSWPSKDYGSQRKFTRRTSPKIENSMMNICRKENISYWALIHRIRRTGESFKKALNHLRAAA